MHTVTDSSFISRVKQSLSMTILMRVKNRNFQDLSSWPFLKVMGYDFISHKKSQCQGQCLSYVCLDFLWQVNLRERLCVCVCVRVCTHMCLGMSMCVFSAFWKCWKGIRKPSINIKMTCKCSENEVTGLRWKSWQVGVAVENMMFCSKLLFQHFLSLVI